MLTRSPAVSTAPVLIIFFMLFLVHLQPLDAGGPFSGEAARTGRLVLILLPYGLTDLCLGIGLAGVAGRRREVMAVLKAAGKALYRAKRSGRNRLRRETPSSSRNRPKKGNRIYDRGV
ncbi:MAG: hypothetical protein PVF55_06770 [Desulfobacterales bacterium]|jgi:hypothetical protein